MPEVSIVISARDNYSNAITKMRNTNQAFNKDMDSMQAKLDTLNKNKATLKLETDAARKQLKDAEAGYRSLGTAAEKSEMETANANYEQARRNLSLLSKEVRQTEKDMANYETTVSKATNRGGVGSSITQGFQDTMKALAFAGLAPMIGEAAGTILQLQVGSMFGSEVAGILSSTASGAISGAAIGSIIPGIGTAIGAAVGGAVGGIQGWFQAEGQKDDAFKGVVQDRYNTVTGNRQNEMSTGISIAAQRQTDRISFNTLFGDEEVAGAYLDDLKEMANHTPFLYEDLAGMSKVLKTYGYDAQEMLPLLTKIGDTGATLGMAPEEMKMVATYLGRMNSTGKTSMEFLNPLLERGIPVLDYMAQAFGKSKEEIMEAVSKGLIPGADAAAAIADSMGEANKGAMAVQSGTYSGLLSTRQGLDEELYAQGGDGYTRTRSFGLQMGNDWLNKQIQVKGEGSMSMGDIYERMGIQKAREENRRDAEKMKAMEEMLQTQGLEALSGAELEALLNVTEAQGINQYEGSSIAQERLASEKQLVNDIAADTALRDEYWQAGYLMGQEFSKGTMAARAQYSAEAFAVIETQPSDKYAGMVSPSLMGNNFFQPGSHAFGLSRVPEDNYPALLHQGERVLTASEARAYSQDQPTAPPVTITGNSFTIREEADVDKVALALLDQFMRVRLVC